jgi:hypothetical protein
MTCAVLLAIPAIALASDVNVAVVDVDVAPNDSVTLAPGGSSSIKINMSVTGNQVGTATFEVYRDWLLKADGTFEGSNPQEFTVGPRAGGDPATTFSTTGTVSVAAGVADNTYNLKVGAFDITNTNTTGAKLAAGTSSDYDVIVESPTPPSDTAAPTVASITIDDDAAWTNDPNGDVSLDLSAKDNVGVTAYRLAESEAGLASATWVTVPAAANFSLSNQSFTLTDIEASSKAVWLEVKDAQGNAATDSDTIGWDKTAPTIVTTAERLKADGSVDGTYTAGNWTNQSVRVSFSCDDTLSGVDTTASTIGGNTTLANSGADQSVSTTGSCVDQAGNSASGASFSNIDIDKVKPVIAATGTVTGTAGSNGWYKSAIDVEFRASDGLSGFANKTDPYTFTQSSGTQQGDTVSVSSGTVTDQAGNVADSVSDGPFKVDYTLPVLNPSVAPNPIILNQPATASANATDAHSGVASSSCDPVDTSSVTLNGAPKSVSCSATDFAGNTNSASANYTVKYKWEGFLQPINNTAHQTGTDVSTFKAGSTVPVKFQLKDADGKVVQAVSTPVWVTPLKGSATNQAVDEDLYSLAATTGGLYRWDATAQQYIYNWSTKGASSGCYYRIGVTLADGQTYYQNISLR